MSDGRLFLLLTITRFHCNVEKFAAGADVKAEVPVESELEGAASAKAPRAVAGHEYGVCITQWWCELVNVVVLFAGATLTAGPAAGSANVRGKRAWGELIFPFGKRKKKICE